MSFVWVDADVAIGSGNSRQGFADVDDGYALIHLLRSPEVRVTGVSTVFGNTDLETATKLARNIADEFSPYPLTVSPGAAQRLDLNQVVESTATLALRTALERQPLQIMAIGPATNIAHVLLLHPELAERITEVVLVAGRRSPEQHFAVSQVHDPPFPDLNFDLDPEAFRVLLQHDIPVTLMPFEISHKVWIKSEHLDRLEASPSPSARYLGAQARNWLKQWKQWGADGFNPFDLLASAYVVNPGHILGDEWAVKIEIHPDDTRPGENAFKPYLLVGADISSNRNVFYGHTPAEGFLEDFLDLLTRPE